MIYGLAIFDKNANSLCDLRLAENPNDLLKLSASSPYYRYVRHLLSVPGLLDRPTCLVIHECDPYKAMLVVNDSFQWLSGDPGVVLMPGRESLDNTQMPPIIGHSLN